MSDVSAFVSKYPPGFPWSMIDTFTNSTPPVSYSYDASKEDYIARFTRLVDQWRYQTIYSSFVEEKTKHSAFKQIVAIGQDAIPLILREIYVRSDFLYLALQMITGENPVPQRDRGKVHAAVDAWIEWGRRSGYDSA